jgi:hypothetical protein
MFRNMLIAIAAIGFVSTTGSLVAPVQAGSNVHHCKAHHCKGWHKHHAHGHHKHGHHKHWHHYHSHKKFRRDPDFNYHPEYGWGYYNDPASNWVRLSKCRRVARH